MNPFESALAPARAYTSFMINRTFTVVVEPDGDVFHAFVPSLRGCHTFGETVNEAMDHIREAITLHIEGMQADGEEIPVEREPFVVGRVSVPMAS